MEKFGYADRVEGSNNKSFLKLQPTELRDELNSWTNSERSPPIFLSLWLICMQNGIKLTTRRNFNDDAC